VLWIGKGKKVVYSTVNYGDIGELKKGKDKIFIKKIQNEWLITEYRSGAPWNLP